MTADERKLVVTFLSILVSIAIVYFGYRPILAGYQTATLTRQARQIEVQDLEARKVKLTQLTEQMTAQQANVDKLLQAVPDDEAYAELLIQLSALANRAGVKLKTVQPASRTGTDGRSVPAAIHITGSYPNILTFVTEAERNQRPIGIQSINIVGDAGGQITDLTASIQLKAIRIPNLGGE